MPNNPPSIKALSTAPNPAFPPVILTPLDVERLLRDDSSESRVDVLEKVSHHYNQNVFASREREIAEHIFRLLMKDAALRVRELLADKLKENPEVPRDIILHMANDAPRVSLPVLASSSVLSDADLVSIVESSSDLSKLMAISQRPQVSSRVSEALVDTNYPQVVDSLLTNQGATISDRTIEKIVEEFPGEPSILETMLNHRQLPITLVERLVSRASTQVAEQLKQRYQLSDAQVNQEGARDDVLLRLLEHDITPDTVVALAGQMHTEGRLTASLVLTALCRGQQLFFSAALANMAGIPLANAQKLLSDKGEHGFHGLYQKSGLPDTMEEAVRLIFRTVIDLEGGDAVPGSLLYANRLAERVLAASSQKPVEYLPYFIAIIRQNVHRH